MHNKLLILLPRNVGDSFSYFSFLINAYHHFDEPEVNILIGTEEEHHFDLLPFKANIYRVEEESLTLTKSGQLAYQLQDLFNITHFFNLRDEARYAYVGRAFRAKKRTGYASGIKKMVYSDPIERNPQHNRDESYLYLLDQGAMEDLKAISLARIIGSGEIKPIILYLDIDKHKDILSETLDELKSHPVIFIGDKCEAIDAFDFENITYFSNSDSDSIKKVLLESRGVVTSELWLARLACLYETNHLLITDNERNVEPLRTIARPLELLKVRENKALYYMGANSEESIIEPGQVTDLILRLFNI
jgi:hypothetical protein